MFIVLHGERCEGGSVVSVHNTHQQAVKAALNVKCHFDGGWTQIDPDYWENGCDFVTVEEHDSEE